MATEKKGENELMIQDDWVSLNLRCDAGPIMGAFLTELRDNKRIWANQCPQCGRMNIPPKSFCGMCLGVPLGDDDWVEQSDEGVLEVFEIHYYEMVHPRTGKVQPVPWANGASGDPCAPRRTPRRSCGGRPTTILPAGGRR